jgi:hypothetical protein
MVAGQKILSSAFLSSLYANFETQDRKKPQYPGDGFGGLKARISCQSTHFAKISRRKSISEPSLLLGRNLHPLTESVNRRVQEEVDSANSQIIFFPSN